MAFFKFRQGQKDSRPKASAQPPSIEAIRQRAKYRLAGATLLVLLAVIGLPLLFDKQPRPIAVDAPIVIPNKNKVAPLKIPPAPAKAATTANAQASQPTEPASAKTATAQASAVASASQTTPSKQPPAAAKPELPTKQVTAPTSKELAAKAKQGSAKTKPTATKDANSQPEAKRVLDLLEGRTDAPNGTLGAAPAKPNRFVLQIGAFSDDAHAREVRAKLGRAGLKTYTQIAQTKDGRRIRVRVGPFSSQQQADQAAAKIKQLQLPVALLKL